MIPVPAAAVLSIRSVASPNDGKIVTDSQLGGIKAAGKQSCFVKLGSVTIFPSGYGFQFLVGPHKILEDFLKIGFFF